MNNALKPNAKTVSLGFTRDDGDFELLATLNNNGGTMSDTAFASLIKATRLGLELATETYIEVKERADAADVVTLG